MQAGFRHVVGCDEGGALYRGRLAWPREAGLCREHESRERARPADEVLAGADVFIGVSVPGAVREGIASMGPTRSSSRWPTHGPRSTSRRSTAPHRRAAVPTIPTRSTICSPSQGCSAAPRRPGDDDHGGNEDRRCSRSRRVDPRRRLSVDYIIPSVRPLGAQRSRRPSRQLRRLVTSRGRSRPRRVVAARRRLREWDAAPFDRIGSLREASRTRRL